MCWCYADCQAHSGVTFLNVWATAYTLIYVSNEGSDARPAITSTSTSFMSSVQTPVNSNTWSAAYGVWKLENVHRLWSLCLWVSAIFTTQLLPASLAQARARQEFKQKPDEKHTHVALRLTWRSRVLAHTWSMYKGRADGHSKLCGISRQPANGPGIQAPVELLQPAQSLLCSLSGPPKRCWRGMQCSLHRTGRRRCDSVFWGGVGCSQPA